MNISTTLSTYEKIINIFKVVLKLSGVTKEQHIQNFVLKYKILCGKSKTPILTHKKGFLFIFEKTLKNCNCYHTL